VIDRKEPENKEMASTKPIYSIPEFKLICRFMNYLLLEPFAENSSTSIFVKDPNPAFIEGHPDPAFIEGHPEINPHHTRLELLLSFLNKMELANLMNDINLSDPNDRKYVLAFRKQVSTFLQIFSEETVKSGTENIYTKIENILQGWISWVESAMAFHTDQ
jgi:hypothetical protein